MKALIFNDDVFTVNAKWLDLFLEEYRKRINVPFLCITHLNTISQQQAHALREANCRLVMVGIQSGSEKFRKAFLHRHETNNDILKFSRICRQAKLNFSFNHIFNFPYETDTEIEEAARLYNEARPQIIDAYSLIYSPKTEIVDLAIKAGVLKESDMGKIDNGEFPVYTTYYKKSGKVNNFEKYALFFTSIPLLPKKLVSFLIDASVYKRFNHFSLLFIPCIKLLLNIRTGTSFMQLEPIKKVIWYFLKKDTTKL